jgi:hypothetical protein
MSLSFFLQRCLRLIPFEELIHHPKSFYHREERFLRSRVVVTADHTALSLQQYHEEMLIKFYFG